VNYSRPDYAQLKPPTPINPAALASELKASRARSTQITHDLRGERLLGPKLAIVNPPLWEIGHVAWFQ
jgi:iron(II)-dependent oxidoreductase